jgi:CBS domain-containing protein
MRPHLPQLKLHDCALRAMHDFIDDPPLTLTEDVALEAALDDMFRLGVRAFLVVRERTVVGLITAEDVRGARQQVRLGRPGLPGQVQRVRDVMTAAVDVPAVDWHMLQEARIHDLVDIFEATAVSHLVVLQSESATLSSVRGLIHRDRLERQLGTFNWAGSGLT